MMKSTTKKLLWVLAAALALGVLLHFLYEWLPSPLTALFSPVRESLWEHGKIVFYPLLLAGFVMTGKGGGEARTGWLLSAVASTLVMLAAAYIYHVPLQGEGMAFDIILYAVVIVLGFVLPRLWPLGERQGWRRAARALAAVMVVLLVWFTFDPPEGILFADLSGGVRTFLTIPV
jgi:hypothetical protein